MATVKPSTRVHRADQTSEDTYDRLGPCAFDLNVGTDKLCPYHERACYQGEPEVRPT